jgi:hypothetical protein
MKYLFCCSARVRSSALASPVRLSEEEAPHLAPDDELAPTESVH